MWKALGIISTILSVLVFLYEMSVENTSPEVVVQETIEAITPGGIIRERVNITLPEHSHVATQNSYSGLVDIRVIGFLRSEDGTRQVDAYYDFSNRQQPQVVDGDSILTINGIVALPPTGSGAPPAFSLVNTYNFAYFVGFDEQPIEFAINRAYQRSYEGNLTITITAIPNYGGR